MTDTRQESYAMKEIQECSYQRQMYRLSPFYRRLFNRTDIFGH